MRLTFTGKILLLKLSLTSTIECSKHRIGVFNLVADNFLFIHRATPPPRLYLLV